MGFVNNYILEYYWKYEEAILKNIYEKSSLITQISSSGGWSSWSSFGKCSKPCGGGIRTKTRTCVGVEKCSGFKAHVEICNQQKCPGMDVTTVTVVSLCSIVT